MSGRLCAFTFVLTRAGEASSFTLYAADERSALAIARPWATERGYVVEEQRA